MFAHGYACHACQRHTKSRGVPIGGKHPTPIWTSKGWWASYVWGEGDNSQSGLYEKEKGCCCCCCCLRVSLSKLHPIVHSVGAFRLTSLSSLSERFPNKNVPRGLKSLWMCHASGLDTMTWSQWKRCRATSKLGLSEPLQPPARDSLFKNCLFHWGSRLPINSTQSQRLWKSARKMRPGLSSAPSILHWKAAMSLQLLQPWTRSKAAFVPLSLSHVQKEACVHTSCSLRLLCSLDQNCLHA